MSDKKKCAVCGIKLDFVLNEIKGKNESIILCTNHLMTDLDRVLSMEPISDTCECCGTVQDVFVIDTGTHRFQLCRKHLIDLLYRCLEPESYRKLIESVDRQDGKYEYYLHDDFYSEDGNAYQPQYDSARALYSRWGIDTSNICIDSRTYADGGSR